MTLQKFEAVIPSQFDKIAVANNNRLQIKIKARFVEEIHNEEEIAEALQIENKVTGLIVEKEKPEVSSLRKFPERDLSSEYRRLKYTDEKIKSFEASLDQTCMGVREDILSGGASKKAGIDVLLIKGYTIPIIMFSTMSYYSTVFERRQILNNEGRL